MDEITTIAVLVIGIVIGIGLSWFFNRRSRSPQLSNAMGQMDPEMVQLAADLKAKDVQLQQGGTENRNLREELRQQGLSLRAEVEKRSAAEAINAAIPQLEANLREKDATIQVLQDENSSLKSQLSSIRATADERDRSATEKMAIIDDAQNKLADAFKALSSEALKSNNQAFLELANAAYARLQDGAKSDLDQKRLEIEALVKPMKESLEKVDGKLQEVEKARIEQYTSLSKEAKALSEAQANLQTETAKLVNALRAPSVRGRWGEVTLKRVVELAGMVDHCDFNEQTSVDTEDGRLRPDMVVNLPNNRCIVVDSKAPLSAYIEALESKDDEARKQKLEQHAQQVRKHVVTLGNKEYWAQFDAAPEFVVLFIPGESFFSAALENDPELIEFGTSRGIILATPLTLIALLKTIHQGWRHERIAENAKEISDLGKDLYERVYKFADHLEDVGKHLDKSVDSYNKAVGTFEGRVLVSTRRFKALGATTSEDIPMLEPVDKMPRKMRGTTAMEDGEG